MIQTVTKVNCDVCGESCKDTYDIIQLFYKGKSIDVCHRCTTRLAQSAMKSEAVIPRKYCPDCNGKGSVREHYGPHNDYETKKCETCGKFK